MTTKRILERGFICPDHNLYLWSTVAVLEVFAKSFFPWVSGQNGLRLDVIGYFVFSHSFLNGLCDVNAALSTDPSTFAFGVSCPLPHLSSYAVFPGPCPYCHVSSPYFCSLASSFLVFRFSRSLFHPLPPPPQEPHFPGFPLLFLARQSLQIPRLLLRPRLLPQRFL